MWHSVSAGGLLIKAYVQIANSRGGRCLVLDDYDYRYVRNKVRNNQMYWRCARAGCGVYMTTEYFNVEANDPDINVTNGPGHHGHAAEADLVDTTALTEQMLQLVVTDPSIPTRRVYDTVRFLFQIQHYVCHAF